MGYKLLYDKQILFDVYSGDYVTDAQLSMSVNAISYFDFTISLTHSLYAIVAEHAGIVELYFDDAKLFSGEITEISVDLNGNKDITCAGALDYLSYTLVRPYSTIDGEADLLAPSSVDGYFNWLIEQHNKHCLDSRKHFFVGVNQGNLLDNNNYIYRASSTLPTTSSEIEDKILNSVGGYLYVRYKDDKNILDLYADTHEANTQIIDFGVNITDFVKTTSTDDQYTAVIATGYTPDPPEDDPQKKMNPITLEGCVDGGTPYSPSIVKMGDVVYDVNAVARYGYKEYHVSNDDIKTYDGLLQYACKVLNKLLSPSLNVSVKAVDLSLYMKDKYEHMQVGQTVRVRSKLHNIDEYLVVNSITLDMNNPENTEYQLGESYDTLTGQQSSYLRSLNSSIVSNLDSETKKNAKDIADTKVVASNAANKANKASEDATDAISKSSEAIKNANVLETLIRQSGDGVEVAKKVNDEYTSSKTLMGPDGFYIKDLTDTALTQIKSNSIILGKETDVTKDSSVSIKASYINLQARNNLSINGYSLKDFVKQFGTSTTKDSLWPTNTWEWRWIKTYSGKCFAWGECGFNIGCTTAWGSGYYDHVCPVYPFKLSKWNVQASVGFIGGGIGHTGIYDDSATQCPIYIWSAVYQNTGTMYVKVFVEGVLA